MKGAIVRDLPMLSPFKPSRWRLPAIEVPTSLRALVRARESSMVLLGAAIGALAAPMIGGTTHWLGPVLGALLLVTIQQIVTVTISSEINVLVVGVLLVLFVVLAPDGIIGFFKRWLRASSK